MEQESREGQGSREGQEGADYPQLASLLVLFLHSPSPDLEHRLARFPPQLYLQLILNPAEPREVRQACCSSFKAHLSNRPLFAPHADSTLHAFETVLFTADPRALHGIEGSFEMLTEKLLELYLDDEKKLAAFTGVMQRVSSNASLASAGGNLRAMRLAQLLVRAMDPSTLNNEVVVGELVCLLKQLYYRKHATPDPHALSGRALDLLAAAMADPHPEQPTADALRLQVEAVQLISEIIDRLESEDPDGDIVPAAYIRNSDEIEALFTAILCVTPPGDGRIYSANPLVNDLKAALLSLYLQQFPYHVSEPFLLLCFATVAKAKRNQLVDSAESIVAGVLQLLERSTSHAAYAEHYYSNTQVMVVKLLELSAESEAELRAATEDPEHFVEVADDYCKSQESDSVKVRAGSLLYNLCLTIDGNLTFVANLLMIPLYALEAQLTQTLTPDRRPRELCVESAKGLPVLLEVWSDKGRPESLTGAALLALSCLSDLVIRRAEFALAVRAHLEVMAALFQHRQRILQALPPVIVARYVQLFSFYSYPHCLDALLPLYPLAPLFAESLLKALETIIQFHDKKAEAMRNYVALVSTRVLLLSERLTPLLEKTILERPELVLCVREKLVEKLVNWLLDFCSAQNVFGANKIANLLCKVIEHYAQAIDQGPDEALAEHDLQSLQAYLDPLYRLLADPHHAHGAEECLIDVAVQHLECLGARVNSEQLGKMVAMGVAVVSHNGGVLNKCLELFSRTLAVPGMQRSRESIEFLRLRKEQVENAHKLLPMAAGWLEQVEKRDWDHWQLLLLLELVLATLVGEQPEVRALKMERLWRIYSESTAPVVRLKVVQVWLLAVQAAGDERCEATSYLRRVPLPERMPPYERNNFMLYLMGALEVYSTTDDKLILLRALLRLFHPSPQERQYLANYEAAIHCRCDAETEVAAFQTVKTVLHPLNAQGIDTYSEFRAMCGRMTDWPRVRAALNTEEFEAVRDVLGHEMVGAKVRRILHIRRPQ